jgi:ankyrin repeat protein
MFYPHGPNSSPVPSPELFQAVMENDAREVASLLRQGVDPNQKAPNGYAPLIEAVIKDLDPAICKLLVEHGADVNVITPKGAGGLSNDWTPLFYAVYGKRQEAVAILLKHGAKVNIRDSQGKSPLDRAREAKNEAIIQELKAAGAR